MIEMLAGKSVPNDKMPPTHSLNIQQVISARHQSPNTINTHEDLEETRPRLKSFSFIAKSMPPRVSDIVNRDEQGYV